MTAAGTLASTNETIRIQGRDHPVTRTRLRVDQLKLDPLNPRIQYLIGRHVGAVDEADLEEMLWEKDQVKALSQAILQNEGVYDALMVQKVGNDYIVREGNSRTVAARKLVAAKPGDPRFETVPVMIFNDTLTDEDLNVLLADMHVTGKIRWDAYEQAKHVAQLHHGHGKTYDWLATHLRLSRSRINQDLKAFDWTTEYLQHNPGPKNLEKFAFFQELARKKDLVERYTNDADFRHQFDQWVTTSRLTASHQVRRLPEILANPTAAAALESAGYDDAARILITEDPALASGLYESIKRATAQIKAAPMHEVQDLSVNSQKLIMLRNLNRAIDDLATLAGVTL